MLAHAPEGSRHCCHPSHAWHPIGRAGLGMPVVPTALGQNMCEALQLGYPKLDWALSQSTSFLGFVCFLFF